MSKILVIGEGAVDLCAYVDTLPRSNEDSIDPKRTVTRTGGVGYCAADVFETLNMDYFVATSLGTGVYADFARQQSLSRGITFHGDNPGTGGCTYTMIDREGNHGLFVVPGAEYEYRAEYIDDIHPEDYDILFLSGNMFDGEGELDLLDFIRRFQGHVFFEIGSRSVLEDKEVLSLLFEKHPTVYATGEQLHALTNKNDLMEATEELTQRTGAPVLVLLQDGTGFYLDGRNGMSSSSRIQKLVDSSGLEESFGAAFLSAELSGLGSRAALNFASEYIGYIASGEEMTVQLSDRKNVQNKLVKTIVGK